MKMYGNFVEIITNKYERMAEIDNRLKANRKTLQPKDVLEMYAVKRRLSSEITLLQKMAEDEINDDY